MPEIQEFKVAAPDMMHDYFFISTNQQPALTRAGLFFCRICAFANCVTSNHYFIMTELIRKTLII